MERYAIIIKTDGVCVLLHCYPGDCLSLEEMQKIVEGHIEAVPTALARDGARNPASASHSSSTRKESCRTCQSIRRRQICLLPTMTSSSGTPFSWGRRTKTSSD